jgi:16S rRNA (guanine527-N7)-methyltransferase
MTLAGPLDDVSRETSERLGIYASLLREWNPRINLVSRQTLAELETRHFLDSAQLLWGWCRRTPQHGRISEAAAAFQALSSRSWRLNVRPSPSGHARRERPAQGGVPPHGCPARQGSTCHGDRAKDRRHPAPRNADVISARALAPLAVLLEYCDRHLAPTALRCSPKARPAAQRSMRPLNAGASAAKSCPASRPPMAPS